MLGEIIVVDVVLDSDPSSCRATFRIFKIERKLYGHEDLDFLERVFQKLLINFTWYVKSVLKQSTCLTRFSQVGQPQG